MHKFDREYYILHYLDHPNIIKYRDPIKIQIGLKYYLLVPMDFYPNVDLCYYLSQNYSKVTENLIKNITFKILQMLKYLEEHEVVHNNIKFENFLVKNDSPLNFELILTDFETAQVTEDGLSDLFGGTSIYKAPEVLRREPHSYVADVWSLGMNVACCFMTEIPFNLDLDDSEEVILQKVTKCKLRKSDRMTKECWECISRMLAKDPMERISARDAMELDWFKGIERTDEDAVRQTVTIPNLDDELIE